MAFRVANKKPEAIESIRGFAKQKLPQFTRTFFCFVSFLRTKEMKIKTAQQQALLRAKLHG
jgi:hypothetical protein